MDLKYDYEAVLLSKSGPHSGCRNRNADLFMQILPCWRTALNSNWQNLQHYCSNSNIAALISNLEVSVIY